MAVSTRAIKNRIKSVKNTKKVTKAMEMVAAAKMRKTIKAAIDFRSYAALADDLIYELSSVAHTDTIRHPLLSKRPMKKILYVVVTSNRGLCGNFNSSVITRFNETLHTHRSRYEDIATHSVIAIGKKGAQYSKSKNIPIVALYERLPEKLDYEDIIPISDTIIQAYKSKEYDAVYILSTHFISALVQKSIATQILPLPRKVLSQVQHHDNEGDAKEITYRHKEYEPNKKQLLNFALPRLVEIKIYQALLEARASEHSSRMVAMKNAHESATSLINDLTLEYNKARQASITREISEIVAGADALR